jgi:hypothetical protein
VRFLLASFQHSISATITQITTCVAWAAMGWLLYQLDYEYGWLGKFWVCCDAHNVFCNLSIGLQRECFGRHQLG